MLSVDVHEDWTTLPRLLPEWEELSTRSADDQPTLSAPWLTAWWDVFGGDGGRRLVMLAFRERGRLVGLAPLLWRRHWHRSWIPLRRLELLGSGEDENDEICSEYIGVLAERGAEGEVAGALVEALDSALVPGWDELVLRAMNGESVMVQELVQALADRGHEAETEVEAVAPYVPLPESFEAYLSSLSSSERYFVKRSERDLDKWTGGDHLVRRAVDGESFRRGLHILMELHEHRWSSGDGADGGRGAFDSARFRRFHARVARELFARGALDLRWLLANGRAIGALYNIVWGGRVQYYQSGRRKELGPGVRPGVVLHLGAIRDAIEAGHKEYDFLGGSTRFKRQLALSDRPIVRVRVARPSVAERVLKVARFGIEGARALRELVGREDQRHVPS